MGFYLHRTPALFKKAFRRAIWRIPSERQTLFLTFDDGPTPDVTEYVLEQLNPYQAKATFFVVGRQVENHPDLFSKLMNEGHSVGNHTFDHLSGWNSSLEEYLTDVQKGEEVMIRRGYQNKGSFLFRPPYGRLTPRQYQKLKDRKVVMWEIVSGDFEKQLNLKRAWNAIKKSRSGDILVFHDSQKAFHNLKELLPRTLDYFSALGYQFQAIKE